jgi:NADH:ubiquinone reductase (H+-translocating)
MRGYSWLDPTSHISVRFQPQVNNEQRILNEGGTMNGKPNVVIIGAGFGGMKAATSLKDAPVDVILIDRHNYHTFQPLLYQVATAALDPEEIAHTIRGIFHDQENFHFRLGNVVGVNWEQQEVLMEEGATIPFNYLIVAAGVTTNYFNIPGVEAHSFPLKTVQDALTLRSHVMRQFEMADTNPALIDKGMLNFVVVGGGPTGVEMAGSLLELFDMVLRKDFQHLEVSRARVILVEATDKVLAPFHPSLRENALKTLEKRGVEVMLNEAVVEATAEQVVLKSGKVIPTRTLVWAAGVKSNKLADSLGLEQTKGGRIVVNGDLSVPGKPHVFVVGDMAAGKDEKGELLPQLAQPALQGAAHVVKTIKKRVQGDQSEQPPFRYVNLGTMATIGRSAAVTEFPFKFGPRFTGFIAWLMWLFLHLMYLVGFRNRLNVFINWAWNYFTYDRSARLIFEEGRQNNDQNKIETSPQKELEMHQ